MDAQGTQNAGGAVNGGDQRTAGSLFSHED